ncbi:SAM-dependent methyltransferase [Ornithinicoccus halotolerans]|uniref:SAM-dependent methyltransferase n=1 Tax=Ornithinicoccus halotolerans TaxID=1748220 RepID=UPI001885D7D6|nr:SAM-dependent methyltransferase [Ornithinicoccus halotolerans]
MEVAADGQERWGPPPPGAELSWLDRHVLDPEITRAEVGLARDRAFADLAGRVEHGLVVAVDYGHTRQDRPRHGTLTGNRHGAVVAPVPDGTVDLTAHVAVDTLPADDRCRQRDLLAALLGRPDLPPHDLAAREPGRYLQQLQQVTAHRALADPAGPGGFWWVARGQGGVVPSLR